MADHLVLVDRTDTWKPEDPELPVAAARDYLSGTEYSSVKRLRVINLCRNYEYLGLGYYCSLLAEARGHRVIPSVRTIQDLSRRSIYGGIAEDLLDTVQKAFGGIASAEVPDRHETVICFGKTETPELVDLSRQIFELYPCPILKLEFRKLAQGWQLHAIRPGNATALMDTQHQFFFSALQEYLTRRWRRARARSAYRYDLAILQDPAETLPPSNPRALKRFEKAAELRGVDVEFIGRKDFGRLAEFDALFIRETTRIDHHTYRFATRAENEGIVVIDDPDSILKCANKVYLAELLKGHNIPTPKSLIVRRETLGELEREIGFPLVLKIPDGAFSTGVFKVDNADQMRNVATRLFKDSDLILAQAYLYTAFDWRIGILNRKPLYACRYYMARSHWQIVKHRDGGDPLEGESDTVPVFEVPEAVLQTALRAADLIGDGLYGVDIKQTDHDVMVIEINDNPSIDAGIEDAVLGDGLYAAIIDELVARIEKLKSPAQNRSQSARSSVSGAAENRTGS
ncbi:MAG TPA: RimK family protein [Gammaproteobacteria bacterium]|nr:RimK family protein [Gammaproteobacteria bacterium]